VLVQTMDPGAAAIEAAARHDTEGFLAGELERRRALRYPPYADLIRVVVSAEASEPVRVAAARVAEGIAAGVSPRSEILGPAPLFRLRGRERRQVVVKTGERAVAVRAVAAAVAAAARDRSLKAVAFSVDVDPQ
jgi:primosomal protein N' (replication factor Y)